ncbi:uncharacterized protein LTR77_008535 [Saxophila tyrrhenica]|uniref:Fe2OG dioxygenase domain-containing protein n=1 Tax=Saxophila tyrrhenica TaxID=1690608 RepID=A0AAV9P359_9PEZI|nr:hypothetical protein LTR77_008535 [Saxophila tyrrhenica]
MGSAGVATSHHLYPPFPSDIITAPLVSISLSKLESGDEAESQAFYDASKKLGFFYLKLEGSSLGESMVNGAEELHKIQQEFFKQPNSEKEEFAREKIDPFFGYRKAELKIKDENGLVKRNETYNMRKDDFIGNADPLPCHPLVTKNWNVLKQYVVDCRAAIDLMIGHLETHLQLPKNALAELHRITARSGDHVRFNQAAIQPWSDEQARQGEHTDFGTLTILMNWLGGLQIRHPETQEWVYVKPIPGSAIVNLGDALVKFTAGILRSNIHRVVPPAPPQDGLTRNSLVYFSRPEDAVVLRRLKGGLINQQPQTEKDQEPEMTAQEWTLRRSVGDLKGVYTHKGGLELRERQMVDVK